MLTTKCIICQKNVEIKWASFENNLVSTPLKSPSLFKKKNAHIFCFKHCLIMAG